MGKFFKKWYVIGLLALAACGGVAAAASVDAFFAGRGIRMTPVAAATCSGSALRCIWFDTSARFRFWNGSASVHVPAQTPTRGRLLYGTGATWQVLEPQAGRQVLAIDKDDGGVKWVSPTDGGLVLP